MEYLAELSHLPLDAIKQALAPGTVIRWTDAGEYRRQVETAISAQRAKIEQLLRGLESAGVLTPDEADALQLRIVINPDDERQEGRALPDMPPVPVRPN